MDISRNNFWRQLPRILMSIAESRFVAIDIEMTGISDQKADLARNRDNRTKQELYEDGKRIASKFQVFQIGFTCIKPDGDDSYQTESYSLYVSPFLSEETQEDHIFAQDIDRHFNVSLNTLAFLRNEGVRLEKVADDAVPYLSRKEIQQAYVTLQRRTEMKPFNDHRYSEEEEGLDFFRTYVSDHISAWIDDRRADKTPEIEIRIPNSDSKRRSNVYHKIVRMTAQRMLPHMKCRTWDYGATVLIFPKDPQKEEIVQFNPVMYTCYAWLANIFQLEQTRLDRLHDFVTKQSGIQIIITALSGGEFLEYIDPSSIVDALASWPGSMSAQAFCEEVEQKYGSAAPSPDQLATDDREVHISNVAGVTTAFAGLMNVTGQKARGCCAGAPFAESHGCNMACTQADPTKTQDIVDANDGENAETAQDPDDPEHKSDDWIGGSDSEDAQSRTAPCHRMDDALRVLQQQLAHRQPVIVGHNQFWDLLFLYQTFINDLPDTAEEFFANIHNLFPRILDTKILAIHDQAIEGEDPLADIFDRFNDNNTRLYIFWDPSHGYGRGANAHDAGYDSFMTATIFLQLAHRLARASANGHARDADSHNKKMRRLYSKGWLVSIGKDPDYFGPGSDWGFDNERDSNDEQDNTPMVIDWGLSVFDTMRNTLRIGPFNIVYLEG